MNKERKYWLRLTRTCNNKCIFCLDYKAQNGTTYSLPYLKSKIKKGFDQDFKGKQRLILSGGEPTLNPNYIELIRIGKDIGFNKIQTITNGRMFYYNKFIKQANQAGLDEITFSLHGHNAKLHDELTGIKGSFEQVLGGLKNALKLDFIVNVDIVVNKKNYKKLLEIIKFYHKLGVNEFDLLTIMPYGRAWDKNFTKLFYDLNDFKPIFQKVIEYGETNNLVIWYNRFPINYFEDKEYLVKDVETKLYHEIFGERLKNFERYLEQGKRMKCLNIKRCSYCFLSDFCAQLFYFNNLIKNRKYVIDILGEPFCLNGFALKKVNLKKILNDNVMDLDKFFKFYLMNLNTYKSIRCKDCKMNNQCRGLHIDRIKEKGFKIIKPIK